MPCRWIEEHILETFILMVGLLRPYWVDQFPWLQLIDWGMDYCFPTALMSLLLMANINNMFYWKYKANRIAAVLRDMLKHIWQLTSSLASCNFFQFHSTKKLSQCQLVLRDQWISSWCCLNPEKWCSFNSKYGFIFLFTPWKSSETSTLPIIVSCRS